MDPREGANPHEALESARQRRADLHDVLVALEMAIAAPVGAGRVEWAERVGKALRRVGDELDAHVTVTEGADGLYAEMLATAPRLAPAVGRLQAEHADLRAALDHAGARVADVGSAGEDAGGEAREAVLALLGDFARHRQAGADLVYEAYETDIGGG